MAEYGVRFAITDAANKVLDKKIIVQLQATATEAVSDRLFVDGQLAAGDEYYSERDASLRTMTHQFVIGAAPDPRIMALVARQQDRLNHYLGAMLRVNDLPWWRFLWLKLRGKMIVDLLPIRTPEQHEPPA